MSLFSDINTWDVGKTLVFSCSLNIPRVISENRDMVNVFYCLMILYPGAVYLEILMILHLDALELTDQKGSPYREAG